jgi:hypothetical protein
MILKTRCFHNIDKPFSFEIQQDIFSVLGIKPRTSHMLGNHSTTELYANPRVFESPYIYSLQMLGILARLFWKFF